MLISRLTAIIWLAMAGSVIQAQEASEEHASHHPGSAQAATTSVPDRTSSATEPGQRSETADMGEMMRITGRTQPQKPLYPTLITLPEFTPEKRAEAKAQADKRMQDGTALMSRGLDRLSDAVERNDFNGMQESTQKIHEGLAQFNSGVSAHRALGEGRPRQEVALQWFRAEMNLPQSTDRPSRDGRSWFHAAVMVILVLFSATMIIMYFFKMRRAASLFQELTGGTTPAHPPEAPPAPPPAAPSASSAAPGRLAAPGKWSGKMRVSAIFDETPSVKTFRLMNPLGGVLPFNYLPGQFLTVTVSVGGKPVKRSYTISSSPTQRDYAEITVKHEQGGAVSGFLHDQMLVGDLLECSAPSGSFIFTGRECKCILLIGGGVGITPLMSVLRYLTDRSWPGDIYLIYGIKTPEDFIFREELGYLQRRHPNLRVVVTVSKPEGSDWEGPTGRITKEFIQRHVPDLPSRYVHLCGPVPMMEAARKILIELGVPADRIKTEAFGPALGKPEPPAESRPPGESPSLEKTTSALPTVTFSESDKSAPLPPDKPILDVADEIGVEIDNSCRVGTCGTCRVKLLAGQVTMAVEDGLEPGDKENNIILACQAKSTGNVTVQA